MNDTECVPGRLRLGMCERHYRRHRRTGSTASARLDNYRQYRVNQDGCWIWTGALWPNGYGKPSMHLHGTRLAHRAFYIEHVGPIADDMDVDHTCHNADPTCVRGKRCEHRACVNPDHLQAVPHRTNLMRAIETRERCRNGHVLAEVGVRPGTRECPTCWRARYKAAGARYRARKRGEG